MLSTGFGFHNDDVLPEHSFTLEKMDLKMIKPDKDSNFIYANNPLYSGTLKSSLAFNMEKASITLANHQLIDHCNGASLPHFPANEYYARQMARAGQDHTAPHCSALRRSITDNTIRMPHSSLDANGSTANASARDQRERTLKNISLMAGVTGKDMRHQLKLALSESSEILREYSAHKEPIEKSLLRLEAMIQARGTEKKKAWRRLLTPLQFLSQVREWLPQVMTDTQTDYITMTRTCDSLLKPVRERIHHRLDYLYISLEIGTSKDYGILCMVAIIIYRASEVQFAR